MNELINDFLITISSSKEAQMTWKEKCLVLLTEDLLFSSAAYTYVYLEYFQSGGGQNQTTWNTDGTLWKMQRRKQKQ